MERGSLCKVVNLLENLDFPSHRLPIRVICTTIVEGHSHGLGDYSFYSCNSRYRLRMSLGKWICAVVIRRTQLGLEFWMLSERPSARWTFPVFRHPSQSDLETIVAQVETRWHLRVRPLRSEPIAALPRSRNEEPGTIRAFLLHYVDSKREAIGSVNYKSRWCLPEEAQRRIRRKPLQRIVQDVHRNYGDQLPLHDGS